ncbi:hypothetical protein GJ744_005363 [Endocarpon pusillum]|uniref:Uncharacterized protein n=1 Tax=Endocarpon pusillum TaxID=364733 RepID=A0A8H7AQJ3_9EURO|nr:hypothetical protein GJ744_005363 [Endocarpon pusillum]
MMTLELLVANFPYSLTIISVNNILNNILTACMAASALPGAGHSSEGETLVARGLLLPDNGQ